MKFKDESGAIMLEATYCVILTMFVFLFMISFGFVLYQNCLVHIVANEAAAELSQTYKYREVSDSSAVSAEAVGSVGMYRFMFGNAGKLQQKNEQKLQTIASTRLMQTNLAQERGALRVSVERIPDDLGRYHLEITVSQKYGFLLGDFLALLGLDEAQQIESKVYVAGTDVLFYMNSVRATKNVASMLDNSIIGSVISAFQNLFALFS